MSTPEARLAEHTWGTHPSTSIWCPPSDRPRLTVDKHAPDEFAHRVRKGFKRAHLAALFASLGFTRGAEIGVADGQYSEVLCKAIPKLHLLCVDLWAPYDGNSRGGGVEHQSTNFRRAQERLAAYDVELIRDASMDAVAKIPEASLDFVYIDGNHDFDWVMSDIIWWSKRVRSGGIVAGHDFYYFRAGVVEAVVTYTAMHDITDWYLCDEREPSFWWTKP